MSALPSRCPECHSQTFHHCKRRCGWWKCGTCCTYGNAGRAMIDKRRRNGTDASEDEPKVDG